MPRGGRGNLHSETSIREVDPQPLRIAIVGGHRMDLRRLGGRSQRRRIVRIRCRESREVDADDHPYPGPECLSFRGETVEREQTTEHRTRSRISRCFCRSNGGTGHLSGLAQDGANHTFNVLYRDRPKRLLDDRGPAILLPARALQSDDSPRRAEVNRSGRVGLGLVTPVAEGAVYRECTGVGAKCGPLRRVGVDGRRNEHALVERLECSGYLRTEPDIRAAELEAGECIVHLLSCRVRGRPQAFGDTRDQYDCGSDRMRERTGTVAQWTYHVKRADSALTLRSRRIGGGVA